MRVRTVGFLSALLLLLTAISAYGASLSYQPDNISITVEPGQSSAPVTLTVQTDATKRMFAFVTFKKEVTGDIQTDWIETATMTSPLKLVGSVYSAETTLTVTVPEDTPSGTYEGYMVSEADGSAGIIDGGQGVSFSVSVAGGCSSVPVFSNVTVGPENIWTPNNKDVEVMVRGMMSMPEGCDNKAAYEIIDEYGEKSVPETTLIVNGDGSFSLPVSVEAYRKGSDGDGRVYTIALSAENEAGPAEVVESFVRVGHDQSASDGTSTGDMSASKKNVKKAR